mgnify:CR=1 FL=1
MTSRGVIRGLSFFSLSSLLVYYAQPTKAQWREATGFISDHSSAESLILFDKGGYSNEFMLRDYYTGNFTLMKLTWSEGWRDFQQISEQELLPQLDGQEDFWLILARNSKTQDYYKNILDQHYHRDISPEFYGMEVYHYTRKPGYFFPIKY